MAGVETGAGVAVCTFWTTAVGRGLDTNERGETGFSEGVGIAGAAPFG